MAGAPSAMSSPASIARVKANDSPGMPCTANGFAPSVPALSAASGCVHMWVIVSGLYWKTITFGSGVGRNVGMNSTSAPLSTKPLIAPPPRLASV